LHASISPGLLEVAAALAGVAVVLAAGEGALLDVLLFELHEAKVKRANSVISPAIA